MIAIRPGLEGDVDGAMALVRDCISAMLRQSIDQWDEVYPNRSTWLGDARERTLYVASHEAGPLVAAFVLNEFQDAEYAAVPWTICPARVAVLHRLLVHPSHQNRGVATTLVRYAEGRALELGYDAIRLDAFTRNPAALRLYHRLGYRDAGAVTLRKGVFRCFEKAVVGR
jgi:GNAT superfamily N-acetyltransferase